MAGNTARPQALGATGMVLSATGIIFSCTDVVLEVIDLEWKHSQCNPLNQDFTVFFAMLTLMEAPAWLALRA